MSPWAYVTFAYIGLAVSTASWPILAVLRGVKLHDGGPSFDKSPHFSDGAKKRLADHYGRLQGTLGFWKSKAELNRRWHFYVLFWALPVGAVIPVLVQSVTIDGWSKLFLTVASAHVAVLLAMHRAFKVDSAWRAFRHGESDFYDTYRRLLDRPHTFGASEEEQLDAYFDEVENIRKFTRNAETDNLPTLDQAQAQLKREPK